MDIKKFNANVTTGYPFSLPDMKALDAKAAKEAEEAAARTLNEEDTEDDSTEAYYEDENGELVIYDD